MKTGPSHKSVQKFLFGRQEEWSTKLYGIGAQTVYMLWCLIVCVGVLLAVSEQQMAHCSCPRSLLCQYTFYYVQR
jgi:hypothetical protein